MRRTLVLLATMTLVVVASGSLAVAASSLVNGSFETGDLTGWTVDTPASGGGASAVPSFEYWVNPHCESCSPEFIRPREGSSFALLTSAGQPPQITSISQPFEASNGDKVSGWVFFRTYTDGSDLINGAGDDKAQVVITNDSGTTVATPFEDRASWGYWRLTYPGWSYWEHRFSGLTWTAQFRIEARIQNPGPNCWMYMYGALEDGCSVMGLDDVKTSIAGPDTTPPETYMTSGPDDTTTSTSATFEFYSNEQGSTFECRLWRGNTIVQEWAACTSPKSYTNLGSAGSVQTSYTFHVRAKDPAGNVDPNSTSWSWYFRDTTAPEVISTVPKADGTEVGRTTNVTATFSEDMDASSINGETFMLFKQGSTTKIAASVSYNATTYTATLNPSKSLRSGATYKAVVTTGAKDVAGNPLAQQKVWFFPVR